MGKHILVVTSSGAVGREKEYNDWYDSEHLADVLKVPGMVSGQRYDLSPGTPMPAPAKHLAIFEIEADDPGAVVGEMMRRVQAGEMSMTSDIDPSSVQMWLYAKH